MPFVRLEKTLSLIEGYRQQFTLNGTPILLLMHAGQPVAFVNRCPHQGGLFSRATLLDNSIVCPRHGIRFSLVNGTADNQQCGSLQMIPLEYEGAFIGVRLK